MVNIELLDLIVKTIEADPAHHRQAYWRSLVGGGSGLDPYFSDGYKTDAQGRKIYPVTCNTAFCFAGWAVQLCGEPIEWAGPSYLWENEYDQVGDRCHCGICVGGTIPAADRAIRVLGISSESAAYLFSEERSVKQIKAHVNFLRQQENKESDDGKHDG
jgi:hypothetical protein